MLSASHSSALPLCAFAALNSINPGTEPDTFSLPSYLLPSMGISASALSGSVINSTFGTLCHVFSPTSGSMHLGRSRLLLYALT